MPVKSAARPFPLDDGDGSIVYTGEVMHTPASAAFLGTLSLLDGAGEEAELAFTGRKVGILARKTPPSGKVQVWIDGSLVQEVDLYSSVAKDKLYVYLSTLASGPHVLRLVWSGAKKSRVHRDHRLPRRDRLRRVTPGVSPVAPGCGLQLRSGPLPRKQEGEAWTRWPSRKLPAQDDGADARLAR